MSHTHSGQLIDIVKRSGQRPTEHFSHDKLHRSIYAACASVRTPDGEAANVADIVCKVVITWCDKKPVVTSADIRRVAAGHLDVHNPEAAYMYKHHRLVI